MGKCNVCGKHGLFLKTEEADITCFYPSIFQEAFPCPTTPPCPAKAAFPSLCCGKSLSNAQPNIAIPYFFLLTFSKRGHIMFLQIVLLFAPLTALGK